MPLLILEKYGEEALFSHTKVYQVGTSFVAGDLTMNSRIAMTRYFFFSLTSLPTPSQITGYERKLVQLMLRGGKETE